jgi:hypothetical protein
MVLYGVVWCCMVFSSAFCCVSLTDSIRRDACAQLDLRAGPVHPTRALITYTRSTDSPRASRSGRRLVVRLQCWRCRNQPDDDSFPSLSLKRHTHYIHIHITYTRYIHTQDIHYIHTHRRQCYHHHRYHLWHATIITTITTTNPATTQTSSARRLSWCLGRATTSITTTISVKVEPGPSSKVSLSCLYCVLCRTPGLMILKETCIS